MRQDLVFGHKDTQYTLDAELICDFFFCFSCFIFFCVWLVFMESLRRELDLAIEIQKIKSLVFAFQMCENLRRQHDFGLKMSENLGRQLESAAKMRETLHERPI